MKVGVGEIIVIAWTAFLGGFTFLAFSNFALFSAEWCSQADEHCLRAWIGALSGWAAALAAGATITVLLSQAATAKEAVEVARLSLDSARISNEQQLRAYLLIDRVDSDGFDNADVDPQIRLQIKNSGKTPAYNVSAGLIGELTDVGGRSLLKRPGGSQLFDIGPGQEITCQFNFNAEVVDHAFDGLVAGTVIFLIGGTISYRDAFEMERRTIFKYVLVLKEGQASFNAVPNGTLFE